MTDFTGQLDAALAGRYRLERELGRGGMATVFLAEDLKHRRRVAIKVLSPELTVLLGPERFLREIEISTRLQHPHILTLLDSGEAQGLLYYVMPFVEGESLRERLARERQLPVEEALRLAREVADALDHAHRAGVVHRDIKPENILLQAGHAVVADFGIARAVSASGGTKLTTTGTAVGTPAYMSPEQVMGSRDLDGRSDLYSLGCVLYEMLAGVPPFAGAAAENLAHQHLSAPPPPVTSVRPSVPEATARAIAKCLAKTPADRFGTAAQLAEALGTPMEVARPTAPPRRRRRLAFAASFAAFILLALVVWRLGPSLIKRSPPDPAKKDWILVAEFDGPAADSAVVAATRDLVMAALDQSEVVATVPLDQIREALQTSGKPANARVDADLARELAYRSAVRAVLEGRVGRLGRGYSIVLRVVDADSARVLASVSDVAADEKALIPTVGRIAKRLRADLGERRSAIRATRNLVVSITPSFEAYKAFERGRALLGGEDRAAIAWLRRALALDPDYASAWAGLGTAFGNLEEPDSSVAAFREALARPERLTEAWRLAVAPIVLLLSGDLAGALAASEREVQLMPQSVYAHMNRGYYLSWAGRLSESLESARAAEKVSPLGALEGVLNNQFWCLLQLGQVDEARRLVPRLRAGLALEAPMHIAAAAGQWSTAESLAIVLQGTPSADEDIRRRAATALAAVQASRGQVTRADETLREAQSVAETNGEATRVNQLRLMRLALIMYSRGVAATPREPGLWDSTTAGLVTRGLWAAAAGDTTQARRLLATIRARSAPQVALQGFAPALLQAWIAAHSGRWQEVLSHIGPAALQGEAAGFVQLQSAPLMRWMAAEAYDRLGSPDSAAAYFERAIAAPPLGGTDLLAPRMAFSFAHRRLVLLYARMGRLEEARRHWEIFSATFTRPDPEMAPLVEEARVALASAEGMAKSARR